MKTDPPEVQPEFTLPLRQIVMMMIVVGLVGAGTWLIWPLVQGVFLSNLWLNGAILFFFALGALSSLFQVWRLIQSIIWIEGFVRRDPLHDHQTPPGLLAPLAALLRSRGARMQISPSSSRSMLDSVGTRMDESSDVTHYLGNLLIFLGLLGTFYGLATTVPALVDTIRALGTDPGGDANGMGAFDRLMKGLEAQLGGMGTAFSSSLLGLAGSLVVGLLALFADHGQNRFYRELEEWLSSITRVGYASGDGEGGSADQGMAALQVLDQISRQMEALQDHYARAEVERTRAEARLADLANAVDRLAERTEGTSGQIAVMARLAEGQERLIAALSQGEQSAHGEAEARMRLRSIDVQLLRILEEISAGRQESTTDLRADLAALTAAIRQLSRANVGRV